MKKIFITGGAGFIGSNLAKRLAKENRVTCFDNLILGRKEFLSDLSPKSHFKFIKGDLLNADKLSASMKAHDLVFHLAANSDISYGIKHSDWDLRQGTLATYNVLEAMRNNSIQEIIYSSSSVVYGEFPVMPTPEDYGPLFPISLYGASKLACEALISAFCHHFNMKAWIYRFANISGENLTHGVIFDFIKKLKLNPKRLKILGDGEQAKPYLYVQECIDAMLFGYEHSKDTLNYFNLSCDSVTSVKKIANIVIEEMGLKKVKLEFTGGKRGWSGDVPHVRLNASKMNKLGWKANLTSDEAVRKGICSLLKKIQIKKK